jgi:hypothetical protein
MASIGVIAIVVGAIVAANVTFMGVKAGLPGIFEWLNVGGFFEAIDVLNKSNAMMSAFGMSGGVGGTIVSMWVWFVLSWIGWGLLIFNEIRGIIGGIQALTKSGKYSTDASGMPLV